MEEQFDGQKFFSNYEAYIVNSFEKLWAKVKIEYDKLDSYSVIGALLSRQVTLSIEMSRSPNILNGHAAPLFLRPMVDLYITLSWIMLDLAERSKKFILHGLGEKKLLLEHYKKESELDSAPEDIKLLIDSSSKWINAQRNEFLVEVNLGNWAQLDYRKMAHEVGCENLYNFVYKPFSQASHNMWPHISVYNSKICNNPLHKNHFIPALIDAPLDLYYLYLSCKYLDMTYQLFMRNFNLDLDFQLPLAWWEEAIDQNS